MTLPTQKRRFRYRHLLLIAVVVGVGIFMINKEQQPAEAHPTPPKPLYTLTPTWPSGIKAAAVGTLDAGVLASTHDTKPRPIASIAKVITALAVLEKHPMQSGESGPLIPITEADEQLYRDYVARNGTVVLIKNGIPISERDALEAMLLPSSNNIADTTAIWAFGSLKKYREYANNMLQRLGLHDTTVGKDASGLDPGTKSTAQDLVRLGQIALKQPIVAQIVALPAAEIPFAGPVPNYNGMVTKYGYLGIKPGESIEAGNTLLFAAKETINGKPTTVLGAILGSEDYHHSNAGALQIVESVKTSLRPAP